MVTVCAALSVVRSGAGRLGHSARDGMGVTGLHRPVFWGFYIVDFVFWIGISHAAR